jgi:hypothetical protein
MNKNLLSIIFLFSSILFLHNSCSKGGGDTPAPDPCTGVTITVNGTSTNPTTPSAADGTISAMATGATGFTYSINGGTFQAAGNFTGLAAGVHTVTAKSANGCTGTKQFTLTAPNLCAGITIAVTGTPSATSTPCVTPANGSLTASATGSTGFTYSINGTTFQSSGSFTGLAAGNYTVTAKDANGCTGTASVTIAAAAAGPLFIAVKDIMTSNCSSCHNNTTANGGMNWTVDCNIVLNKERIKVRAVDQGTMPTTGPLSQANKDKITAWINAGGRFTD